MEPKDWHLPGVWREAAVAGALLELFPGGGPGVSTGPRPPLLSWMEARGCPALGGTSWKRITTIPSAGYPFHPILFLPPFIPKHQGPLWARLCARL